MPGGQQPRLREFKQIQPVEPTYAIGALVLGLIGMGFVGSRAAARLWHAVHRDKAIKRPVSRRVRERWVHEGLQRIRLMAKEPPKDPQAFYAEIGQFMRQYLTEWLNVEARGLTPERPSKRSMRQATMEPSRNGYARCWNSARRRNTAKETADRRVMASTRRHCLTHWSKQSR